MWLEKIQRRLRCEYLPTRQTRRGQYGFPNRRDRTPKRLGWCRGFCGCLGGLTGSYRCEVIVSLRPRPPPSSRLERRLVFEGSLWENPLRGDTFSISKQNVAEEASEQSRCFSSSLLRRLRLLIFCCFSFFCGRKRAKQATVTWKVTGQLYSAVLAFAVKMEVIWMDDDDEEEGVDTGQITGSEGCQYPGLA